MAERDDQGRKHAPVAAWLLLAPGLLWLIWFFFIPLYTLGRMSLSSSPSRFAEPVFNWHWANFDTAFSSFGEQFLHSFVYAVAATLLALVIAYPLAYFIAFRGGRWKNLLLGLVVVPFFTNFLIRTLAWKTILGDQGTLVTLLRDVGLLSSGGTLLRTPAAGMNTSSDPANTPGNERGKITLRNARQVLEYRSRAASTRRGSIFSSAT